MSERSYSLADLSGVLPHRGVNLMLDSLHASADAQVATSQTHIQHGDQRGRELLARLSTSGAVVYEPFVGEILALTGIPLIHDRLAAAGHTAVFSMVSRVTIPAPARLHRPITGEARIVRDRAGFTVYATKATQDGVVVLEAEVMSGAAVLAQIGSAPVRPLSEHSGTPIDRLLFSWKDPRLVFIDRVLALDAQARTARFAYTYPSDHPFVPGHFPGMPVMMGMTQWAAVADAVWYAARQLNLDGEIHASGTITRPDGTQVLDVRELTIAPDGAGCRILSTKRLAFREPVRPGDGLIIDVALNANPAAAGH